MSQTTIIKPRPIESGDIFGFIAPASAVEDGSRIDKAEQYFIAMGHQVKHSKNLRQKSGYLAGTDAQRLADLHQAFTDPVIRLVLAVRGGFGSGRLLDSLQYETLRSNPKLLVGYSDITALQLALWTKARLVSLAGPMPAVDFWQSPDQYTTGLFWRMISEPSALGTLPYPPEWSVESAVTGRATGRLLGGNLSLLAALCGSGYMPDDNDFVLFIEDIDEQPYRIDRMLNQLKQSGFLGRASGIIIGQFTDCYPADTSKSLTLEDVFAKYLYNLGVPVLQNFPHGHCKQSCPLPQGIRVELDTQAGKVSLMESITGISG